MIARASLISPLVPSLVPSLLVAVACASTASSTARTYVRPALTELPLRSIDVVVVALGPPRSTGETLDVKTFDPPEPSSKLIVRDQDQDSLTRNALVSEIQAHLEREHFMVRVSSSAPSIEDLARESDADALLVVRVVPVDAFTIDVGTGTRIQNTPLGRETIRDRRPITYEGRLLVGQAFLFDRKTRVRLWTKQAPDFPDGARLTAGHPFLAYGFVHEGGGPAPASEARATQSAHNFTSKMFADFPSTSKGRLSARAELDEVDEGHERVAQRFFDEPHFTLEVGVGWALEPVELEPSLAERDLAPLGTGAIAPSGILRVKPQASYIFPGGWMLRAGFSLGRAPSGFARSYYYDNAAATLMDPEDRATAVAIDGASTYGLDLDLGWILPLTSQISLVPATGLFGDLWSIDVRPESVVESRSRGRLGVSASLGLWFRPAVEGPIYGCLSAEARGGVDLGAPAMIVGIHLSAGVGVIF